MINLSEEQLVELINSTFSDMCSGNFCGCYEGDITGEYEYGIKEFIEVFLEKLHEEEK